MPAPKIPSVSLALDPPREVVFDYGRLESIELGTRKTILQIVGEMIAARPAGLKPGEAPTAEQAAEASARVGIGFMARFVAACLDVTLVELPATVPMPRLLDTYFALANGLVAAINQLEGGEDAPDPSAPPPGGAMPANPTSPTTGAAGASGPSEPGPASS